MLSHGRLGRVIVSHRTFLTAAALVMLTIVAYWPALRAGYIWDDDVHVTNNVYLRSLSGLAVLWSVIGAVPQYYPLTHTSFWLEYHLWGLHPFGYHLDNILLQSANAVLLLGMLRRLKVRGAWMIAAIFAIHPMQVESVAWVTERKNLLSGLLFLLALTVYLPFFWPGNAKSPRRFSGRYFASLGLFILALLSKSVTGSLPGVILVLTWWKRGRVTRHDVIPLIPFFALSVAMGSLTGWMERHIVGAIGPEFAFTPLQRFDIAGRAICFYVRTFLFPARLSFIYPRWDIQHGPQLALVLPPMALAAALLALWLLRRQTGRGPISAAMLFIGMLFPALGFVNVYPMRYSFVADHFQYLAGIALAALVVGIAGWLIPRRIALPAAGIALAALATLTWNRTKVFASAQTIWLDVLAKDPNSLIAHNNFGVLLQNQGDFDAAEQQHLAALRSDPSDTDTLINLGQIAWRRHDTARAVAWYLRAQSAAPRDSSARSIAVQTQIWAELAAVYDGAAHSQPGSPYLAKSLRAYQQALALSPDDENALLGMGHLLGERGEFGAAIANYQHALRIDPDSLIAHYDLGNLYFAAHDLPGAIRQFVIATRLDPRNAMAENNLGSAYAAEQRWGEAITAFRAALWIDPHFALAASNLRRAEAEQTQSAPMPPHTP